jgi:hypothetical protein
MAVRTSELTKPHLLYYDHGSVKLLLLLQHQRQSNCHTARQQSIVTVRLLQSFMQTFKNCLHQSCLAIICAEAALQQRPCCSM